jgi:hypothetical protein
MAQKTNCFTISVRPSNHTFLPHTSPAFPLLLLSQRDTRLRSWQRYCATSRKVAGSISDCVIGIFHWYNTSGPTLALGLTQSLAEISIRDNSWGVKRSMHRADKHTTLICRLSWNLRVSTSWKPQGHSSPVMVLLYSYLLLRSQNLFSDCSSLHMVTYIILSYYSSPSVLWRFPVGFCSLAFLWRYWRPCLITALKVCGLVRCIRR